MRISEHFSVALSMLSLVVVGFIVMPMDYALGFTGFAILVYIFLVLPTYARRKRN